MGYSSLSSQALSAPPYLISFFVVILTSYLSDRYRSRSIPLILHALLGSLGYGLIALAGSLRWPSSVRYFALYPAAAGFFSAVTLIITWTLNNQPSESKKGTGITILNVIGQCGPLLGTRLYPDEDGPYYVRGMALCACFMGAVAVLTIGLRIVLKRENLVIKRNWETDVGLEMTDIDYAEEEELLVKDRRKGSKGGSVLLHVIK